MKLVEYLDTKKLLDHIQHGIVQVNFHPTLPLALYTYTRKCIYDNLWDDVTRKTRGLIVDVETNEIIARPFEKFFSIGQDVDNDIAVAEIDEKYGPPVIQGKVNGSLGIFWRYGIHWGIATKGSFTSDHAKWATKWLEDHIEHRGKLVFPEGYTPVFEIICQTIQEHPIKYENDGLVLLALINKETGEELDQDGLSQYAVKNKLHWTLCYFNTSLRDVLQDDNPGWEGYVVTYNIPGKAPFKLKIKFPTYLENRKKFYEELEAKRNAPNDTDVNYIKVHTEILATVRSIVEEALIKCTTRKEFADFFLTDERKQYAAVCFAMTDEKDYKSQMEKLIEIKINENKCKL